MGKLQPVSSDGHKRQPGWPSVLQCAKLSETITNTPSNPHVPRLHSGRPCGGWYVAVIWDVDGTLEVDGNELGGLGEPRVRPSVPAGLMAESPGFSLSRRVLSRFLPCRPGLADPNHP